MLNPEDISQFDSQHLWHPYATMADDTRLPLVVHAQGCRLTLADGRELIDGMASWWAAIQGYNHPELNQAVTDQLQNFAHVMFGGLTHEPAARLGKLIVDLTAPNLDIVFYSDSGSVAVEVALKMALQHWQGADRSEKHRIMTLRKGYHGDTFATMAMADPDDGMHGRFNSLLYDPIYLDRPPSGYDNAVPLAYLDYLEDIFVQHAATAAALVLEPVVQNAGGMNIYNPQVLLHLRKLCDEHEVLLVLDEIATGFGRTGKLFAYEHAGIEPDILCLGKAMSAGYLSFAATVTTNKIAAGVSGADQQPLMHGPTYMANALAASVAAKNLEMISQNHWQPQVAKIEKQLRESLSACKKVAVVRDVRVLGAIGVIEVNRAVDVKRATSYALNQGVWLRPFRNLIYLMPPYIISDEELQRVTDTIVAMVDADEF